MIQAYEATPEPSILLAYGRSEFFDLLAIVLEGFGYRPLACAGLEQAEKHMQEGRPAAAIVDWTLEESKAICEMLQQPESCPVLVVFPDGISDLDELGQQSGAQAWERASEGPERMLEILRRITA
ncbi:MAG: hypothetical protein JXR96_23645 [Deltaproteobacteria bacterium]|nr:hypothetical protein [Deltaproteobacteria bacterium]